MKKISTALTVTMALVGYSHVGLASNETITVATYGGTWGDAIDECIITPFEKATGHSVVPEPGVSGVTLSKLNQQKNDPSIDVVWLDGGVSELANEAGVLSSLNTADIPNLDKILPEGKYSAKNSDDVFAVSTGFYAVGIVYDEREVAETPSSWEDLWKPKYSGLVTVPSPSNAMGIPFIMAVNSLVDGNSGNVSSGMDKITSLDVFGYFDTAGSATNTFQAGEVVIGAHYATSAWAMAEQGLPIQYVVPNEGALGGDIRLHLVKNTPREEVAKKFINFAIDVPQAQCMSEKLYIGPATQHVELTQEALKKMPWGENGSVENLIITDWDAVNSMRDELGRQWNRQMTN